MSRQSQGLRFEHKIASEIYDATGGSVMPMRCGYSGNQAVPSPDLLIPYKGSLRAVEIKTSSQKRMVVKREDLKDVLGWAINMNEIHTFPYLTVKFMRYEAQTMRLEKPWDLDGCLEILAETSPYDTNVTRGGNISFGHPTHYDCDVPGSSSSPKDGVAVLRDLRDDEYANVDSAEMDTVGVHEIIDQHGKFWENR